MKIRHVHRLHVDFSREDWERWQVTRPEERTANTVDFNERVATFLLQERGYQVVRFISRLGEIIVDVINLNEASL